MARAKLSMPKKLAGVKIPKSLRRIGKDVLRHPMGRVIIAELLVHAAAGLLRNQAKRGSVIRSIVENPLQSAQSVRSAGSEAAGVMRTAAGGTVSTIAHAIDDLLGHIQDRRAEAEDDEKPRRAKIAKGRMRKGKGKKRKTGRPGEDRVTH